jgi:ankyrin repeat protein
MKKRILTLIIALFSVVIVKAQRPIDKKLFQAVRNKDTLAVASLLEKGANPNVRKAIVKFEMSMLILAVQNQDFRTVKLLVENKAEIDWKDWFKSTALMYAAYSGNVNIIRFLLERGADIKAHDDQGNTVLSAAKEGKHPEAIKLIEELLNK